MRWHDTHLSAIDAWAEKHDVNRSEAIRRLVDLGLKAKGKLRAVEYPPRLGGVPLGSALRDRDRASVAV